MVGGIAHNFNNILAGMTGNLYLAKQQVGEHPNVVQKLANVEELSGHAAEMTRQLLAFARKGMINMKEMPLAPFIKETLKLLHASVPDDVFLENHPDFKAGAYAHLSVEDNGAGIPEHQLEHLSTGRAR